MYGTSTFYCVIEIWKKLRAKGALPYLTFLIRKLKYMMVKGFDIGHLASK